MDLDSLAQDVGIEQVALELHGEKQRERHDQGQHQALGHQRHQDDHDAGHEHADQRDQRAQEEQHTHGDHQRHTGKEHDHDHGQRIDQRQQDGAAHVGDQRPPGDVSGMGHLHPTLIREEPHDPPPDATVVGHQEQGREEAEDRPADDDERAVGGGENALSQAGAVLGDGCRQVVDEPVDLGLGHMWRARDQPALDLSHGVLQLATQRGRVRRDLLNDEPGCADQRGHTEHEHQERRRDPRHPMAHQQPDRRLQERADHHRHDHRDGDQAHGVEQVEQHEKGRHHDEETQRPRGRNLQTPADGVGRTFVDGAHDSARAADRLAARPQNRSAPSASGIIRPPGRSPPR